MESWGKQLDSVGIKHSPVIVAIQAWLIVFDDPDGRRLRLCTLETHGPELAIETDSLWLK